MKKTITIAAIVAAIALVLWAAVASTENKRLTAERDRYKQNTEVLSTAVEHYKTADSLNAARVRALELSLDEFERFRAQDAQLIKSLKQRNRDLQSVNDMQMQTIIEMQGAPRDTIIVRDSVPVKAKAVECGDPWYSFKGLLTDTDFSGRLETRDSLIISESVEHKRFLGFLWKMKAVKNRQIDAVNRSPHSKIADIVFVVIED